VTSGLIALTVLGIFFGLLFLSVPIAVSLGLATITTMLIAGMPIDAFADIMYAGMGKNILLAIPFFIMTGLIMEKTGVSNSIIKFAKLLIGPVPGGLGIMSIAVAVFWGAISGSGPATVAALGSVLIPAMMASKYRPSFAAAIIASGSGISVVIPPSGTFIIYGVITSTSVARIYAAGMIPGILMGVCFAIFVMIYSIYNGYKGESYGTIREIFTAFKEAIWGLLTPVIILGGIYGGFFSPTESACFATVYVILIGLFVYKQVTPKDIYIVLAKSALTSASILLITASASMLSYLFTTKGIARLVSTTFLSLTDNAVLIMLIMLVILLIAGCFLDGISIVYLFVPLFYPLATQLGYDTVWFGIMVVMTTSIGMITPPVAVNLYPAARYAGCTMIEISKSVAGFVISGTIAIVIAILFPGIATWLPNLMKL
jgi:C4-dicarboxylate transporter DctM subunit